MTGAGDEDADGGEKPRRLVSPLPDSAIPICRTILSFFLFSSQLCLLGFFPEEFIYCLDAYKQLKKAR